MALTNEHSARMKQAECFNLSLAGSSIMRFTAPQEYEEISGNNAFPDRAKRGASLL